VEAKRSAFDEIRDRPGAYYDDVRRRMSADLADETHWLGHLRRTEAARRRMRVDAQRQEHRRGEERKAAESDTEELDWGDHRRRRQRELQARQRRDRWARTSPKNWAVRRHRDDRHHPQRKHPACSRYFGFGFATDDNRHHPAGGYRWPEETEEEEAAEMEERTDDDTAAAAPVPAAAEDMAVDDPPPPAYTPVDPNDAAEEKTLTTAATPEPSKEAVDFVKAIMYRTKPRLPVATGKEPTTATPTIGRLPRLPRHSVEDITRMNLILDADGRVNLKSDAMMLPWGISPDAAGIIVYSRLLSDTTLGLSVRLNLAHRLLCLPLSERWFRTGATDQPPLTPENRARLRTHPRRPLFFWSTDGPTVPFYGAKKIRRRGSRSPNISVRSPSIWTRRTFVTPLTLPSSSRALTSCVDAPNCSAYP
jgi:hypothetical protein